MLIAKMGLRDLIFAAHYHHSITAANALSLMTQHTLMIITMELTEWHAAYLAKPIGQLMRSELESQANSDSKTLHCVFLSANNSFTISSICIDHGCVANIYGGLSLLHQISWLSPSITFIDLFDRNAVDVWHLAPRGLWEGAKLFTSMVWLECLAWCSRTENNIRIK